MKYPQVKQGVFSSKKWSKGRYAKQLARIQDENRQKGDVENKWMSMINR